ncbi:MAG: hypothetical protein M1586_02735 [Patescibacteria group bacterium]|nr:hypothetical protein [Patescibacteria group bacterium]MCL5262187.1 hypothetical protein [Patescibacteria group bacterium]
MRKVNYLLIGLAVIAAVAPVAFAQALPPSGEIPIITPRSWSLSDIYGWPALIFNWAFWLITIWTVGVILWTAFEFVRSSGDPAKLKGLGTQIRNIFIGILLAILAKSIPAIIASFVKGA